MSIYKELNTNPSRRDLLSFGLIFLGGMGIFGAAAHFYSERPGLALTLWIVGFVGFVLSFIPAVGRVLYILWMGLGLTIGAVTSPIIMVVLYFVIIVPVGFVLRLARRDTMRRPRDLKASSYWEDYPRSDDPASYIRQF